MKRIVSIAAFSLAFSAFIAGQDIPKVIKGGILNGKAVSLPKPAYPDDAKAAKLGGTVQIKVLINEDGFVESAEPSDEPIVVAKTDASGKSEMVELPQADPSLVEAARTAALSAKFSPTRLSGVPVKVSGVITYNFVAGSDEPDDSKSINGGVVNGKALDLPKPEYPAAALAVKAGGTVSVKVLIDENGEVISAAAVSGHPLLRAAATEAARNAKFAPTQLNGQTIKVSGVITYNFAPPASKEN